MCFSEKMPKARHSWFGLAFDGLRDAHLKKTIGEKFGTTSSGVSYMLLLHGLQ